LRFSEFNLVDRHASGWSPAAGIETCQIAIREFIGGAKEMTSAGFSDFWRFSEIGRFWSILGEKTVEKHPEKTVKL
jgi:hypothetical protein